MADTVVSKVTETIKEIGLTLLAMSGILVDNLSRLRVVLLLLTVSSLLLGLLYSDMIGMNGVMIYFVAVFVLRYILLFASFVPNGIAERMIRRYGEATAFQIYQAITALFFIHRGLSFGLLIERTSMSTGLFGEGAGAILTGAGVALTLVGMVVNVWAALIIGIDAYYYKDLFVGRSLSGFKQTGPYRYFANPMYGIGQANGYGSALLAGSIAGIVAMAINQASMYLFYYLIEKKHIERVSLNGQ